MTVPFLCRPTVALSALQCYTADSAAQFAPLPALLRRQRFAMLCNHAYGCALNTTTVAVTVTAQHSVTVTHLGQVLLLQEPVQQSKLTEAMLTGLGRMQLRDGL